MSKNNGENNEDYAPRGIFRNQFQPILNEPRLYGSQGSNSSAFQNLYGSQVLTNQEKATQSHRQTAMANNDPNYLPHGGMIGEFGFSDVNINNNQANNNNGKYGAKRQLAPYHIQDGSDNIAFDFNFDDSDPHNTSMQDRGTSHHRPLRQRYSDSTDMNTMQKKNQNMLLWKKTEEQLRLRRRLPRTDIQALLDAVGHRRLQRARSSRRYRDDEDDDYRDPDGYIPSQDSLKKRTIEPPRRPGQNPMQILENREDKSDDDIIDLTELFRSGSAYEKSWGKQINMK